MAKIPELSREQIANELESLASWSVRDSKLHATFEFPNFVEAFAFMTKVAIAAECMDHHPEWSNVYGTVNIDLVTHAAGNAITKRDIALARAIDALTG